LFALTFMSVRGFCVEPSLHRTKWYPVFGTAVTSEPQAPQLTICRVIPLMEPFGPAM